MVETISKNGDTPVMENQVNSNAPQAGTIPIRKPGTPTQVSTVQSVPQYPTEVIELPSKGWFYDESNPLSSGKVELKMMTAKEEDILTNQNYVRKGILFEKLLSSLIVDTTIDPGTILLMDQNALMLAIRRLAYGDSYLTRVQCPRCGEDTEVNIDLGKLEDKEVDLEAFPRGVNRFEFVLPRSQNTIVYKLLNQRDQEAINAELTQLQKSNKNASAEVTTRLRSLIVSVNGNSDRMEVKRFVDNMLAFDVKALRDHMNDILPNVDSTFDFECSVCAHTERVDVPITAQFFWPDSRR
jgi:hypothetical protein